MLKIKLSIDHSKDSLGEAFGVEPNTISVIISKANEKLQELEESGENISLSKMLEVGLSFTETVEEGLLLCFGLGSQHGAMSVIKSKGVGGLMEKVINSDSKPDESSEK